MQKPTIPTGNKGTAQTLADEYRQAASHLRAALDIIHKPRREEYANGQEFTAAKREHGERMKAIQRNARECEEIARACEALAK